MKPGGSTATRIAQSLSDLKNKVQAAGGAVMDFMQNYIDMRKANTIGGDKYFHCKANCEASRRGAAGGNTAKILSNTREWFDKNVKGDTFLESQKDQEANRYGQTVPQESPNRSCTSICEKYRPQGLSQKY